MRPQHHLGSATSLLKIPVVSVVSNTTDSDTSRHAVSKNSLANVSIPCLYRYSFSIRGENEQNIRILSGEHDGPDYR